MTDDNIKNAQAAPNLIEDAIARAENDPGAPFEVPVLDELRRTRRDNPGEYERAIGQLKAARVRIGELEKHINGPTGDDSGAQGRPVTFENIEPWPESVDGFKLLDRIVNFLCRHIAMSKTVARLAALWVIHTHIYVQFMRTPRLIITAPRPECGKTDLHDLIGLLVPKPKPNDDMSTAAFFRLAAAHTPTFLLDEIDSYLKRDDDLLGAINGGWKRGGGVDRCVGDALEVRTFPTFCPMVLVGIKLLKRLPDSTVSRSLIIELQRGLKGEYVEFDDRVHEQEAKQLHRHIVRWVSDHKGEIARAEPVMPNALINRERHNWRPLLAVADAAGGNWPRMARTVALESVAKTREAATRDQLLVDSRAVWPESVEKLHGQTLVENLLAIEDSPYQCFTRNSGPITTRSLTTAFGHYGIEPKQIKIDGKNLNGYERVWFEDAWKRYAVENDAPITQDPPNFTSTSLPANAGAGSSEFLSLPGNPRVEKAIGRKANGGAGGREVEQEIPPP